MSESTPVHPGASGEATSSPRIVLVLGGGGVKGAVQVGVARALGRLGIPVSEVVATSMGALVGAAVATGMRSAEQAHLFTELLEGGHFGAPKLKLFVKGRRYASTDHGRRYHEFLQRHFGGLRMGELELPLFCNALSLSTGATRYFGLPGGPRVALADALYASSCLPGLFEPIEIDGESYIDGGMAEPLGLKLAHARRPDLIVAVDLSKTDHHTRVTTPNDPADVLSRSYEILGDVLVEHALHRFGSQDNVVLIKPDVADLEIRDAADLDSVIERGEQEAYLELAAHQRTRYLCAPDVVKGVDRQADAARDHVYLDVDMDACINCGICAATCVTEGFAAVPLGNVVRKLYHYECVRDSACERNCPTSAITLHHL